MNHTATSASLSIALLTAVLPSAWAQTPFEDLATKIPASANVVVLLDAQRLLASPQAVREDWKSRYEQAFASGSVTMAPDTQRMVLASQMEYETMRPQWIVAVADFGKPRSAAEVARASKGVLDPFGRTPAVALRDNAYAIELGPQRFAAMSPANRQSVARWLRETEGRKSPALTPFLKEAITTAKKSGMVMVFDLEDAIPPDIVRAKLAASAVLKGKNIDAAAAAKVLDGVRGVVLEVAVTDNSYARLLIHFRGDSSILVPVAKPLVQDVLAGLGAAIDDIDGWTVQPGPQSIAIQGTLTEAGRKRIFSLVDNPLAALLAADQSETSTLDREQAKVAASSQQYFKALASVVEEVRTESAKSKTFGQNALWFDKWARRIDSLPVLNVDEELTKFSEYLSTQLREMAAAMRGIGIQSGARTAQVWDSTSVYYSGYSVYAESRDADPERRAIRAEEKAKGATSARATAQDIQNAIGKIRKDLTQKYQVEF